MDEYEKNLSIETNYLNETIAVLNSQLEQEENKIMQKKKDLVASRLDMYENTSHSTEDFDKTTEMVQHLSSLEAQTYDYVATEHRIEKNKRLLQSPYFARIDFDEEDLGKENIYIGFGNLIDNKTYTTYIYDWRAPISSIFYRYELGQVSYEAPCGTINGEVSLKRQFEITDGKLNFFFDSSVNIMDDILKKALSGNSSLKMKTIVETIQREQDIIIRDIENDLVIVQGVAGSGKTSVALHRVAFLLYQGLTSKLATNNIILISPNFLFGKYISNVLPELGEKNIEALTFEDIFATVFDDTMSTKSRNSILEEIITTDDVKKKALIKSSLEFKLSKSFLTVLERFIWHFEHHMIEFSDIHFNGYCVADRHILKTNLLKKDKKDIPVEKRLKLVETRIMNKLQELREERLKKIEKFVFENTNHPFDAKAFARLLHGKQSVAIREAVHKFTEIDYFTIYKTLFKDKELFYRLSKGLQLPPIIDEILDYANDNLNSQELKYEDAIVLTYLKIKMSGCHIYQDIKQVVIDEAQDYYPVHYEILKSLFTNSKYTIMGDINQTIEKQTDLTIYDDIKEILCKKRSTTVFMTKSFRCSYEINEFSTKFIDDHKSIESFERHESIPEIIGKPCLDDLDLSIIDKIDQCQKSGYCTIAILCKSIKQANELYKRLNHKIKLKLINEETIEPANGVVIVPVYMAKGLEFDAVLVYGADDSNYSTQDDKKLLYIACTRALHNLTLYYTGKISRLLI